MTNQDFSESYLKTAIQILDEARAHFQKKNWHLVVRRCQEAVELCLKAWLRRAAVEVPKIHDVGIMFKKEAHRFPGFPIDLIVSTSRRLREEREISIYGDEVTETPAEELYSEGDAQSALEAADKILSWQSP